MLTEILGEEKRIATADFLPMSRNID